MHNHCAKSPLKTGKCTKKSDYCAKLRPIERQVLFLWKKLPSKMYGKIWYI